MDPLAEKYHDISSYAYCENNPLKFLDPDGRRNYNFLPHETLQSEITMDKQLTERFQKVKSEEGVIKVMMHGYVPRNRPDAKGLLVPDGRYNILIQDAKTFKKKVLDNIGEFRNRDPKKPIVIEVDACRSAPLIEKFSKDNVFKGQKIIWRAPNNATFIDNRPVG